MRNRSSFGFRFGLLLFVLTFSSVDTQSGYPCTSTGPTCLSTNDCSQRANGDYQFCGSCTSIVRCQGGSGTVVFNSGAFWDDNCKCTYYESTTCYQCYTPCQISELPPTGPLPNCAKSGPTCVSGITFCNLILKPQRFQYCGNCRSFVNCGGLGHPHNITNCPVNTIWNDNSRSCASQSDTCKECYGSCVGTTAPVTTVSPIVVTQPRITTTTRAPKLPCASTGPTCLNASGCSQQRDGNYQFCGNCTSYLTCQSGVGRVVRISGGTTPYWDDNAKSQLGESSTCHQCYLPCYTINEPPPTGPALKCEKSGPTCVSGVVFCNNIVDPKKFQNCENCRSYVNCAGLGNSHSIIPCPNNTIWDDFAKQCRNISTTCVECFRMCDESSANPTIAFSYSIKFSERYLFIVSIVSIAFLSQAFMISA